jgi:hypothetical protein
MIAVAIHAPFSLGQRSCDHDRDSPIYAIHLPMSIILPNRHA